MSPEVLARDAQTGAPGSAGRAGTSSTYHGAGRRAGRYQRTLGANNQRVQVTTDEYANTHRPSTITTATEHAGTPGTFDEQFSQKYNWTPGGTVSSIDTVHAGATTDSQCSPMTTCSG
jgi:hypothetical protein